MTNNKKVYASEKKNRVKIGKLTINKETVEELIAKDAKQIKGGGLPLTRSALCQNARDTQGASCTCNGC